MAEPEDLILEFAHRGVIAAERLWLRYHVDADAASRTLAGLRPHVEFLLAALTDQPVSVRPADSPVPASWVARLARRSPRHLRGLPPSMATGDAEIHLPRIPRYRSSPPALRPPRSTACWWPSTSHASSAARPAMHRATPRLLSIYSTSSARRWPRNSGWRALFRGSCPT